VPESLLTILKFCLLAVLYLFFVRVLRAVWSEIRGVRQPAAAPPPRARRERAPRASGRASARLRIVEPASARGRTFTLADELTLGRAPGCQISLDDTYVSQLHARLFRKEGVLYVEDLGSTNGTYVNRKKVTGPIVFRKGDRLQVGKTVIELTR
jgi:hypothetical protein